MALENLRGLGWMDLTFGQLDGWWRFADSYRPHHALATPCNLASSSHRIGIRGRPRYWVWTTPFPYESLDKGVIVAQGPALVKETQGLWVILGDREGEAGELAAELAARNQAVLMGGVKGESSASRRVLRNRRVPCIQGVQRDCHRPGQPRGLAVQFSRELPGDVPFGGVVHLQSLDGHGNRSTAS